MPEDPKKKQNKYKQDPKEQRKPRRQNQPPAGEKKVDKKVEEPKSKVPATSSKPINEEPGPDFYKNLKRETDEILKISEEANSKYKKKEILSNWSKYQMPIESYDETEENDLGADYEKLVQTPMSIGGHFQFKHEKSWDDSNTGPSPYDKYFEIDMANLATALNTIPFYDRNGIDLSIFSESDKLSMENRAVKYKRKYFNDKSYTTAELEAQDRIESKLSEMLRNSEERMDESTTYIKDIKLEGLSISSSEKTEETVPAPLELESHTPHIESETKQENDNSNISKSQTEVDERKNLVSKDKAENEIKVEGTTTSDIEMMMEILNTSQESSDVSNKKSNDAVTADISIVSGASAGRKLEKESNIKPVIESTEDLEKWLDDFLDS